MRVFIALLCLSLTNIVYAQSDTFNTSGTWTCPAGVTSVTVACWGGGGGGGYAKGRSDGSNSVGTGGGGGCYSQKTISVVPGNTYTVTVGTGGLGGTNANIHGQAGGDSWFMSTTDVLAKGGGGGTGDNPGFTGVGGSGSVPGSIGNVIYTGGDGNVGQSSGFSTPKRLYGGGGGGSAGDMGNGNPGYFGSSGGDPGAGTGGNGGSGGGDFSGIGGAGGNGYDIGGGGGGAAVRNTEPLTTSFDGGNGGNGSVIITPSAPLPIELVYFTGSNMDDNTILFKWKTASRNVQSVHYNIQGSVDGERFANVYSRKYEGEIPSEYSYRYSPVNERIADNYYRLMSVDENGTVAYSSIIQVNGNSNRSTGLYPNPSKTISFLDYHALIKSNIAVNVSDREGRIVLSMQYTVEKGYNQLPIDVTLLRDGIYSIQVLDGNGNELYTTRLVKN